MPPPSVSPPTPVVEMIPHGTASPCACVAASTSRPGAAAADANRARARGSTDDRVQQREVDDDAVVDAAEAAAVVAAAADREREVVRRARSAIARATSSGARAARDQRRPLVDHRVEQRPRLVVARVVGPDQLALERCSELTAGRNGNSFTCAHLYLPSKYPGRTIGPDRRV